MKSFLIFVALASILSGCASGPNDMGGNVFDYLSGIDTADATHKQIKITGWCASACTLKLGANDVCIYRNATLYFHESYDPKTNLRSELGTYLMFSEYPPKIQEWVTKHNALNHRYLTSMSGKKAISLGIKECK